MFPRPLVRRTVDRALEWSGRGLFSGAPCDVTLRPSDAGVCFVRADLPGAEPMRAGVVGLGQGIGRNTCLGAPGGGVATIEHLMSAFAALGVTDVLVECRGPELPIGDGSALLWWELMRDRVRDLPHGVEVLRLAGAVTVTDPRDAGATITASPSDKPFFEYSMDYGANSSIPRQSAAWGGGAREYEEGIAPARTFCTAREAQAMRAMGLFGHLSPRDMLVLDDSAEGGGRPIENALRFPDEPARHKLLDLIGDLWLLGRPLCARVVATRSGHALTHELCRRILAAEVGGVALE